MIDHCSLIDLLLLKCRRHHYYHHHHHHFHHYRHHQTCHHHHVGRGVALMPKDRLAVLVQIRAYSYIIK